MKLDSTNRHINLKAAYKFYKEGGEENYKNANFKSNQEADDFQEKIANDETALNLQKERAIARTSKNVDSDVEKKKEDLKEAIERLNDEASFLNFRYNPIVESILTTDFDKKITNVLSSLKINNECSLKEAYIISKVEAQPLLGRLGGINDFVVDEVVEERVEKDMDQYRLIVDRDGMLKKVKQLTSLRPIIEKAKENVNKAIVNNEKDGLLESLEILLVASEL